MSPKARRQRYAFEHLTEDALRRDILIPLFTAMKFQDVALFHGPNERGKDILMWKSDDFARVNHVVVAKRGAITGRAQGGSDAASTTAFQVQQALRSTYRDPVDGSPLMAGKVIVVASGEIHPKSREAIRDGLQASEQRAVTFIDGRELADLARKHLPATSIAGKAAELQDILEKAGNLPLEVRVSKGVTSLVFTAPPGPSDGASYVPLIRLKDPQTGAGREALNLVDAHVRTGVAITLSQEMIESIEFPDVLRQLGLGETLPERIEIGPRVGGSFSVVVDVEDTSGFQQRLGPFTCKVVQLGRESALTRTSTASHGWNLELRIDHVRKEISFNLGFDTEGLNVREQAFGLRCLKALSSGARLTFRNGETELPIATQSIAPGDVEAPKAGLLALANALLTIQEFCGRPLSLPQGEVPRETFRAAVDLSRLIEEGVQDFLWSTATIRVDRQAAGRLLEMAPQGSLGRMATRIVSGFVLNGQEVVVGLVESVADQATIAPEALGDIRDALAGNEQWIEVKLHAAEEGSRATKRLLPLGADEEPLGGELWVD